MRTRKTARAIRPMPNGGKGAGKKLDSPFNSRRISIDRNTFTLLTTALHCGRPLWTFVNPRGEEKNPIVYSRAAAAAV